MHAPSTEQSIPLESVPDARNDQALCVDLDQSLIATDVLWESLLVLLKLQPWLLMALPFWLLQGRAALKRRIAERVILDPSSLPYRQDVLAFLRQEKARGRTLVLATASDYQPAEGIAAHLGLFSEVLASDGIVNLSGPRKQQALVSRFGEQGFDYIGDSATDLPVWSSAKRALLVDPTPRVLTNAANSSTVTNVFRRESHSIKNIVRALRVGQWVKNVLVFLPLLASHHFVRWESVRLTAWAFLSFCLCASSIYILNDLLDLPADRRHPKKKFRPFASGVLSIRYGLALCPILFLCAVSIATATLPSAFLSLLVLYVVTTTGYSILFKQVAILDVLILAALYSLRVLAGGFAINVPISAWLLAFSMFLFLSLAFTKRHLELHYRKVGKKQALERRAYQGLDKHALGTMSVISGYLSVLVLALYINSQDVRALYQNPKALWLACPLLLYWISRNYLLAHRGTLDDDPLVLALKDPQSYIIAVVMGLVAIFAL
ncbi:MAG: UbiA family prenyltransferase [Nitrospirales bacterium]|nr:UbiA family prenyltransferase [Nitrospirales bacterium]